MKTLLLILSTWLIAGIGLDQNREKLTVIARGQETLSVEKDQLLVVKNVNGNVEVEHHSGSAILLDYEIAATSVERARGELKLGIKTYDGDLFIFNDTPFTTYDADGKLVGYHMNNPEYHFEYQFKLKVPEGQNIKVSTVNHGKIILSGVNGNINAVNVNGPIEATAIAGRTNLETINGDIEAQFTSQPEDQSSFKSINGTISLNTHDEMSASITFKSMNGALYTDFDYRTYRPDTKVKTIEKGDSKIYKLEQASGIQIGEGLANMSFETLNGDVYLKKN